MRLVLEVFGAWCAVNFAVGGGVDLGGLPWPLVQAGQERAAMGQDA